MVHVGIKVEATFAKLAIKDLSGGRTSLDYIASTSLTPCRGADWLVDYMRRYY